MPHDLMGAIEHAFTVLWWMENLPTEEMPPEWMWPLEHEIERWFEQVERDRKARMDNPNHRRDEEAPMMQNDLTKHIRRG